MWFYGCIAPYGDEQNKIFSTNKIFKMSVWGGMSRNIYIQQKKGIFNIQKS